MVAAMRSATETEPRTGAGGVLIGLASVQFGVVVVLGKLALRGGLSVVAMLTVRFAVAAAILAAALALLRRPLLAARGERLRLVGLGIAGYAVEAALFFAAVDHGTAAAVTLLFFTYPVFVALAQVALGRGGPGSLLGGSLASAVAGASVVVASSGGLTISMLGVGLALGSALMFTGYLIGAEVVLRRTDALTASMWVSASAAVGLGLFMVAGGRGELPGDGGQWARVTAMGAATAGAFVCLLAGLQRIGPVRTSIIAAAEPLSGTLLAVAVLHEELSAWTWVGGALILSGAIAASLARAPGTVEPPVP